MEADAWADAATVCQSLQLSPPPWQVRHQGVHRSAVRPFHSLLPLAAFTVFLEVTSLICKDANAPAADRPAFCVALQHLWVTPYAEGELYPAGFYPLEPNPVGIEQWTEKNRSLVGKDLVLWHTMGVTHIPRPEDFPVM